MYRPGLKTHFSSGVLSQFVFSGHLGEVDLGSMQNPGWGRASFTKWSLTPTWLAGKSGPVPIWLLILSAELCQEMKELNALAGGLIPHSPEPAHVLAFVLLCPHKCKEDESQKYLELRGDFFFSLLPSQAFRPGEKGRRDAGCQQQ